MDNFSNQNSQVAEIDLEDSSQYERQLQNTLSKLFTLNRKIFFKEQILPSQHIKFKNKTKSTFNLLFQTLQIYRLKLFNLLDSKVKQKRKIGTFTLSSRQQSKSNLKIEQEISSQYGLYPNTKNSIIDQLRSQLKIMRKREQILSNYNKDINLKIKIQTISIDRNKHPSSSIKSERKSNFRKNNLSQSKQINCLKSKKKSNRNDKHPSYLQKGRFKSNKNSY